jgi:hypothetical protein
VLGQQVRRRQVLVPLGVPRQVLVAREVRRRWAQAWQALLEPVRSALPHRPVVTLAHILSLLLTHLVPRLQMVN